MNEKRICFLAHANSIHRIRVVNHFAERGWDCHWITYTDPISEVHPDVKIYRVKRMKVSDIKLIPRVIYYSRQMRTLLKDREPLIIHATEIYTWGLYGSEFKRLRPENPLVLTAVGFHHIRTSKGIRKRYETKAFQRANIIVTYNQEMTDVISRTYRVPQSKFLTFPNKGVDLDVFKIGYDADVKALRNELEIPMDTKVILSPRNMVEVYGTEHIVRAIPDVVKKHPDVVFVFLKGYGETEYLKAMRILSGKLGIVKNVRFVEDLVPYDRMPIYYNMSHVTVMLPRSDHSPTSISEAMACGSILVATDIPGNREWISDSKNGFLASADGKGLSGIINGTLDDPKMKSRFTKKNLSVVKEKGDWFRNMKKLEDAVAKLL